MGMGLLIALGAFVLYLILVFNGLIRLRMRPTTPTPTSTSS